MSDAPNGPNSDSTASSTSALGLVSRAVQDGAADARKAADRTWAATSLFVSRFVYTTCYTVSYGVVFPTVLLAHSVPRNNAAVRGLIDGAQAAILKVDELRGQALEPQPAAGSPTLAP